MLRLTGCFYKVRRFRDDPEWTVAKLENDGRWYMAGDFVPLPGDAMAEVGERIILPHGKVQK